MTFTIQEHRDLVSHYVALARKQASSQMRWHYIAANNMAYSAKR
jgi:hypothetical protein